MEQYITGVASDCWVSFKCDRKDRHTLVSRNMAIRLLYVSFVADPCI